MAVLFAVGVMNLGWMAAMTVVFTAEKNWRHGVHVARAVGGAALGLGIAILLLPPLLGSVALVHPAPMMSG